jgi:hypothetical protein
MPFRSYKNELKGRDWRIDLDDGIVKEKDVKCEHRRQEIKGLERDLSIAVYALKEIGLAIGEGQSSSLYKMREIARQSLGKLSKEKQLGREEIKEEEQSI